MFVFVSKIAFSPYAPLPSRLSNANPLRPPATRNGMRSEAPNGETADSCVVRVVFIFPHCRRQGTLHQAQIPPGRTFSLALSFPPPSRPKASFPCPRSGFPCFSMSAEGGFQWFSMFHCSRRCVHQRPARSPRTSRRFRARLRGEAFGENRLFQRLLPLRGIPGHRAEPLRDFGICV